jgi:hypothetical protein
MEVLVRSGVYGQFDRGTQAVLMTLFHFRDPDTGFTQISYRGIAVYSGVESSATISKALKLLRRVHAIQILQAPRLGITRPCNQYRVTLEDEQFLALCNETYRKLRESSEKERAARSELRFARETKAEQARGARSQRSLSTAGGSGHVTAGESNPVELSDWLTPTPFASLTKSKTTQDEHQGQHHSCKGLNLSSPTEARVNYSLHPVKRENRVNTPQEPKRQAAQIVTDPKYAVCKSRAVTGRMGHESRRDDL